MFKTALRLSRNLFNRTYKFVKGNSETDFQAFDHLQLVEIRFGESAKY